MRRLWLAIPLLYSLTACGAHGPAVVTCISDPKDNQFRCYDYLQGKNIIKTLQQADGYICLSPVDEKNLLMSCAGKTNGPLVNLCIYDFGSDQMDCFNQLQNQANHIPFANSENDVCVSASDYQAILTYCAQKKAGLVP